MNVIEQARERLRAQLRAFVLGEGVVERSDMRWGHDPSEYAPAEYGNYIATSNGVYACATLRARLLTGLPLKLYRVRGGDKTEVTTGPAYELLQKVNPHWTMNRLMDMTELSLCLWGSCFWFAERGATGRGQPTELWWGRPDRVRVIPHPTDYLSGFLYEPAAGGEPIPFQPSEVVWFRYSNPLDEYAGLSPLAAARLAADTASAAMQSNRNLFAQGMMAGGAIFPKSPDTWTKEQVDEISDFLSARFKGVDKAHRWAVFRAEMDMRAMSITPRDAEFMGALTWALNETARAYGVPPEMVGDHEHATYSNMDQAYAGVWMQTLLPEARFLASEITEQFLPMFGSSAGDLAEFDASEIGVLQEDETAKWTRTQGQLEKGTITINEWRADAGLKPVPWGDVWWAPAGVQPIDSPEKPAVAPVVDAVDAVDAEPDSQNGNTEPDEDSQDGNAGRLLKLVNKWISEDTRGLEYGGEEHARLWRRFVERTTDLEAEMTEVVTQLFERQQDAVLQRLKQRRGRTVEDAISDPFDMPRWVREFREKIRPVLLHVVSQAGIAAIADLGEIAAGITFNISQAAVQQFIERRAQRFATQVNETTWNMLRISLSEGIAAGESIPQMEVRVKATMADRIRSTPETIARTEVVGASNGGTLEAWQQSGVVERKVWLATLDTRTRDTHTEAHGQTVPINADFVVGGQMGPAPGQIGTPEEDINCRCTMTAEVN